VAKLKRHFTGHQLVQCRRFGLEGLRGGLHDRGPDMQRGLTHLHHWTVHRSAEHEDVAARFQFALHLEAHVAREGAGLHVIPQEQHALTVPSRLTARQKFWS
jgi:hypothetical protein